jgi:hypothetical protein
MLAKEDLEPSVDFGVLASMTEGYSGSDLKNLSIAAAYQPIREYLIYFILFYFLFIYFYYYFFDVVQVFASGKTKASGEYGERRRGGAINGTK